MFSRGAFACAIACAVACGDDAPSGDDVTLDHCAYEPMVATGGAGGTVTAGPLEAGAAEAVIDVPVSTALGAYTARAGFLGNAGKVDLRESDLPGSFNPSIGVESAPRAKALALSAGGETVIIVKLDLGLAYEGLVFDVEARLGSQYAGKLLVMASHSHSAWGQQTGNSIYKVGLGELRDVVYQRYVDVVEQVARAALDARRPAKLGIFATNSFDPEDAITRDRRPENDDLPGGASKDTSMFLIRVDSSAGEPIAVLPIYGVHGTLMNEENSFAATDAPGAIERVLEEQFDSEVVVMHLQGAAGDSSPTPHGGLDCATKPGDADDPCFDWAKEEGHARVALPTLMAAWEAAGGDMRSELELEMMSRSIEKGPFPETFSIRGGELTYAPFDSDREADGVIFNGDGSIASPIDEFNAPVGAGLCEADTTDPGSAYPIFPAGLMPGTDMLPPYGACVRIDTATEILGTLLSLEFEADTTHPICQSTRTTISALRIGDFLFGTIPGEPTAPLARQIRDSSPTNPDKTVILGYAQGHIGYCLTAEDWLAGGYEPSINLYGPLEAEYVAEQLISLMPLALTPDREDATADGRDRSAVPTVTDSFAIDDPAPMAGTIPASVPERVWTRLGPLASPQPQPQISRVSGHATFVWIGDDPSVKTPVVTLERETTPGVFEPVRRHSGRVVRDAELLLMYTPDPLRRTGSAQTHYWVAEWQAVPWLGAEGSGGASLDGMGARAGVPLGNYRFHVVGAAFDITSDPFEVQPVTLGVSASRSGTTISTRVSLTDLRGYRLLDLEAPSNGNGTPVREGMFEVTFDKNTGPDIVMTLPVDAAGTIAVDLGGEAASVVSVSIQDAFGNAGMANVP